MTWVAHEKVARTICLHSEHSPLLMGNERRLMAMTVALRIEKAAPCIINGKEIGPSFFSLFWGVGELGLFFIC